MRILQELRPRITPYFWDMIVNGVLASILVPRNIRRTLLKLLGMQIASKVDIGPGCFFYTNKVQIGKGTWVNRYCIFVNGEPVVIGERCGIGMQVMFTTTSHVIGDSKQRARQVDRKPITVEDGCWIGSRVTILPGVTIGKGCIIAAGAVVINDCEPNGVYAGVPVKG